MARVKIAEFGIIQKILAGATVAVYVSDDSGESTGVLATLYQASTGSASRSNPQTLDDDGKLESVCYVDSAVVAAISNITERTERSVRKIRVNPLDYALPITSSAYNAQSVTAEDVATALSIGWEGAWVTSTAYEFGNIVGNDGSSWICILAHTSAAATEPGTGASWQTYWELFASIGASGSGSGDMVAAQNLNDLASKPTAFSNIKQAATDTATGVVELATSAEAQAGADTLRVITPATLQTVTATTSRKGVVELATVAEAVAGTDTERAVTPEGLAAAIPAVNASGWVPIKTVSPSSVSSVEFIHGSGGVVIDGTYKAYKIVITNLSGSVDGAELLITTSSNAGVSYASSNYSYTHSKQNDSANVTSGVGNSSASAIRIGDSLDTAANSTYNAEIIFYNPIGTNYFILGYHASFFDQSTQLTNQVGSGSQKTAADVDAIKIAASSGTISATAITLYGYESAE